MNKFLLVAINSKYIHSNLAVYCLKAAAGGYSHRVAIKEFTINNQTDDILSGIYMERPDCIGLSCYIWNIEYIKALIPELAKILPDVPIWLGGPEVTYNPEYYLKNFPNITGIMRGEGEQIFAELVACYMENRLSDICEIKGVACIKDGSVRLNPCPEPVDMSSLPMPYDTSEYAADNYKNKIIYYESSRGCPFSCSYCLSSVDKRLRFRNTEAVFADLDFFIKNGVSQVKFVDRTFNCKKEHSRAIWEFIKEHDNGFTNFHFEVAADLLDDEDIEIMSDMREGLIQLEVGVQSTNEATIKAIHRQMNLEKVRTNVEKIKKNGNIHVHLDLIAGLPYEGFESFEKSYNDIYAMKPDQLQLGFLKLLHGSTMRNVADQYKIVCRDYPPYEVLCTDCLSYEEVLLLKQVENVTDMYYNSGMFKNALTYLVSHTDSAFRMYLELGGLYAKRYADGSLPSKNAKYELLYDYAENVLNSEELRIFKELLKYDMYLRDNVKNMPECIESRQYYGAGKPTKAEHMEIFDIDVFDYGKTGIINERRIVVHFDYLHRTAIDNNAYVRILEENSEERSSNN